VRPPIKCGSAARLALRAVRFARAVAS